MQIGPPTSGGRPERGTNRKTLLALGRRIERRGRAGAAAALRHELIELSLVLRHPQAREKILELALLLFEPAQGFLTIFVERPVPTRACRLPPGPGLTHLVGLSGPASHATFPATHSSAPNDEGQGGKADRPPDAEAEDHQRDPGRFSQLIELRNDRHRGLAVNVNHIYIAKGLRPACQARAHGPAEGAPLGGTVRPRPRR